MKLSDSINQLLMKPYVLFTISGSVMLFGALVIVDSNPISLNTMACSLVVSHCGFGLVTLGFACMIANYMPNEQSILRHGPTAVNIIVSLAAVIATIFLSPPAIFWMCIAAIISLVFAILNYRIIKNRKEPA